MCVWKKIQEVRERTFISWERIKTCSLHFLSHPFSLGRMFLHLVSSRTLKWYLIRVNSKMRLLLYIYIYFLSSATGYLWKETGLNWRVAEKLSYGAVLFFFLWKFLLTNERFPCLLECWQKASSIAGWTLKKVVVLLNKVCSVYCKRIF